MIPKTQWNAGINQEISSTETTSNNTVNYSQIWQEWQKEVPQGNGEYREKAVLLLHDCLERGCEHVDLSDLGLTTLPKVFPATLRKIDAYNNPLSAHALQEIHINIDSPLINISETFSNDDNEEWQHNGRFLRQAEAAESSQHRCSEKSSLSATLWRVGEILTGAGVLIGCGAGIYKYFSGNANLNTPDSDIVVPPQYYPLQPMVPQADALLIASSQPSQPSTEWINREQEGFNSVRKDTLYVINEHISKEFLIGSVAEWLFPAAHVWEPKNKVIELAQYLLQTAGEYSGEEIPYHRAKEIVRNWVMKRVLGTTLREYIATLIIDKTFPVNPERGIRQYLQALMNLQVDKFIDMTKLSAQERISVRAMWHKYIRDEVPLLQGCLYSTAAMLSFYDYEFLALCAGAEMLSELDILQYFNAQQVIELGAAMWGGALGKNLEVELLPYLITPSLWCVASTQPQLLSQKDNDYFKLIVPVVLQRWINAQLEAKELAKYLEIMQEAQRTWYSKGELADNLISKCSPFELSPYYTIQGSNPGKEKILRYYARQDYLNNGSPPCLKGILPELSQEYARRTEEVVNAWKYIDEKLIAYALSAIESTEVDYMSAPAARAYPVYLNIITHNAIRPGIGGSIVSRDIPVALQNTDLFAVRRQHEQRIYALKKEEGSEYGYQLYRVDKNAESYIEHGLLMYKNIWKDYRIEGSKIYTSRDVYSFDITVDVAREIPLKKEGGIGYIAEWIRDRHKTNYYRELYAAGNTQSERQQVWGVFKGFIPFYSCIEGLANGSDDDNEQALAMLSCIFDSLSVIPVAGHSVALGSRLGLGLARGIRSGVIQASQRATLASIGKAALKQVTLPTRVELQHIALGLARAFDPGIETLYRGGQLSARMLSAIASPKLATALKKRLSIMAPGTLKDYRKAKLPGGGVRVNVKPIGRKRWMRVNRRTGETFGRYYTMKKGELSKINIRFNRPEAEQPSGAIPKYHRQLPSLPKKEGDNQLLPAPGNAHYWNMVRKAVKGPVSVKPYKAKNTEIMPLKNFLTRSPSIYADLKVVDSVITSSIMELYAPFPWHAWPGIKPQVADSAPPYIVNYRKELHKSIVESMEQLSIVREKLSKIKNVEKLEHTKFGEYCFSILATPQRKIMKAILARFSETVDAGYHFLKASEKVNYSNFIIISSKLVPDSSARLKYRSVVDKKILRGLPFAEVNKADPEARIFFYADSFDRTHVFSKHNSRVALSHTLNHEITHLASQTGDMFGNFFPVKGDVATAGYLRWLFRKSFLDANPATGRSRIYEGKDFANYINRLSADQEVMADLTDDDIFNAIFADEMLLADIMLMDAEVNAVMIRDFASNLAIDEILPTSLTK